jgi:hypothetical protein
MKTLTIHLTDTERTCTVDAEALHNWSKVLIDEILFEGAKSVAAQRTRTGVSTTKTFRLTLAREDGSIVIEA